MTTVLVTEEMDSGPLAALQEQFELRYLPDLWKKRDELLALAPTVDAILVRNQTIIDAAVLQRASKLKIIGRAGVGLDNIDMKAANQAGVVVSYSPGANANAVAELTIGFMIALSRKLLPADAHARSGGWNRMNFLGQELSGRCLAVIGCGAIGRLSAQKAQAMGMTVVGFDPFLQPEHPALVASSIKLMPFSQAIAQADFVSCHVPASAETAAMFDSKCFASMKKGSYFINTSRGNICSEDALAAALESRHLAGAALDVRVTEPPVTGRLEAFDNVILSPHIGGLTHEAQYAIFQMICGDVLAVLQNRPAAHSANFASPRPKEQRT